MAILHQLLSRTSLKALDKKELDILYTAIQREITRSRAIRGILRTKAFQVYRELKGSNPAGPDDPEEPDPATTTQGPTEAEEPRRRPRRRR
jgi:hypothetical protein